MAGAKSKHSTHNVKDSKEEFPETSPTKWPGEYYMATLFSLVVDH